MIFLVNGAVLTKCQYVGNNGLEKMRIMGKSDEALHCGSDF
jgi:hypothetical protein